MTSSSTADSFAVGARTRRLGCAASAPRGRREARSRSGSRRSRSRSRCCSARTSSGRRGSPGRAARSRKAPREGFAPDRRGARARARSGARAARGRRSSVARHDASGRPALPARRHRPKPTGTPRRFFPRACRAQRARRRRRPGAAGEASPRFAQPTARAASHGLACAERPRPRSRTSRRAATQPAQASQAFDLLGILAFSDSTSGRRATPVERSLAAFENAVRRDPEEHRGEVQPRAAAPPARGRGRAARTERRTRPAGQRSARRGNGYAGAGLLTGATTLTFLSPLGGLLVLAARCRSPGSCSRSGVSRPPARCSAGATARRRAARDDRALAAVPVLLGIAAAQPAIRAPEDGERPDRRPGDVRPRHVAVDARLGRVRASRVAWRAHNAPPFACVRRSTTSRRASARSPTARFRTCCRSPTSRRSTPPSSARSGSSARLRRR